MVATMQTRVGLISLLVMLGGGTASADENRITSVRSHEAEGTTTIHIRGTSSPTFSVYKLDRPSRVVVDLAKSSLDLGKDAGKAVWRLNTWAVGEVTAHASRDQDVRVVVNLARPSTYKVEAVGGEVVVKITSREAPSAAYRLGDKAEGLEAEARATRAQLEVAKDRVNKTEAELTAARKESALAEKQKRDAQAAMQVAERNRQEAEKALKQADALRRQSDAEKTARVATLQREAANAVDAAEARVKRAQQVADAAEARRRAAETSLAQAEMGRKTAEQIAAQNQKQKLDAEAARLQAESSVAEAKKQIEQLKAAEATRKQAESAKAVEPVKPATPAGPELKSVRYKGGVLEIEVEGDTKPQMVSKDRRRLVLEIPGTKLPARLQKTINASKAPGAVRAISMFKSPQNPANLRVAVDLKRATQNRLVRDGEKLVWSFGAEKPAPVAAVESPEVPEPLPVEAVEASNEPGYGASSTPINQQTVAQFKKTKTYRGRKIDIDFKDVDIHNLLRLLADVGGVNMVIPDDVRAQVTVRLKGVPWDQALEVILASKDLWYRRVGKLIRIDQRKDLDAEDQAEAERIKAALDSEAPEPEIFTLNYADGSSMQTQVRPMLSPKGRLEYETRTNSLIINDIAAHRRRIIDMLTRLDSPTPQIQIEARIVEARTNYLRQFGIQWGGEVLATQETGNATGLFFPSDVSVAGAADGGATPTTGLPPTSVPSNFAVNMPAPVGAGAGAGLGIALGSLSGAFNLNLRLTALEDTGTVRVVSSPKIITSNNINASIKSGVSIPISVVSASGVQTQFVPADLLLDVGPKVSQRDCSISLNLKVTKNTPDFANTGARGDPSILTQEAKTVLLVGDGETAVIGGIYTRSSSLDYNLVPFFSDIPVLGYLFKSRRETDERTETLIFVTPKITNRASLNCE